MATEPKAKQRKPAYEKKNPAAHEAWKQRNRERNAQQRLIRGSWTAGRKGQVNA